MSKFVNKSTYFLAMVIALFPFVYTEKTLDPVLTLRFFILTITVLVMLIINMNSLFSKEKIKHPISIVLLSIFFISILSSFFAKYLLSEAIYHSLKFGIFFLLYILFTNEIKKNKNKLIKSVILFVFFSSILAMYQYVTAFFLDEFQREINKISGTMANRNLLGSALFLGLPFCLYGALCLKSKIWNALSIVSLLLSLTIFFFIQSKAIFISLIIATILFLIFNIKSFKESYTNIFFLIVLSFSIFYGLEKNEILDGIVTEFEKLYDFEAEISKQKKGEYNSTATRYFLYKSTLKIISNNPITGVGPGNWRIEYPLTGLNLSKGEKGDKIVQRPHNDFLWVMSEMGVLAGVLYILLFLIVLSETFRLIKKSIGKERVFYSSIFVTIFGYMFISAVDFPLERISHNILFFLLVSLIVSASVQNNTLYRHNRVAAIICLFVALFASFIAYTRHQGEIHMTSAKLYKGNSNWHRIIKEVDKSFKKGIYEIDRSSTPIHWYSGVANFSLGHQKKALEDFKIAYSLNPNHLHVLNNLATCYELNGNSNEAKKYYYKALNISPRFEEASVNLAAVLFNEGKLQEALTIILRCDIEKDLKKYNTYLITIINKLIIDYNNSEQFSINNNKKIFILKNDLKNNIGKVKKQFRTLLELNNANKKHYIDLYLKNF